MYRRGVVSAVDVETHRVRVKFPDRGNVESPWLDVLVRDALDDQEFSLPSEGVQVACLLEDNGDAGCVLGALYTKDTPPPEPKAVTTRHWKMKDGASFSYDRAAKKFKIDIPSGGELELVVGGDILFKPMQLVKVSGAADFVALSTKCDDNFTAIKGWGDAHVHPTGVGPSGPPPPVPAPEPTACTKVKTD